MKVESKQKYTVEVTKDTIKSGKSGDNIGKILAESFDSLMRMHTIGFYSEALEDFAGDWNVMKGRRGAAGGPIIDGTEKKNSNGDIVTKSGKRGGTGGFTGLTPDQIWYCGKQKVCRVMISLLLNPPVYLYPSLLHFCWEKSS